MPPLPTPRRLNLNNPFDARWYKRLLQALRDQGVVDTLEDVISDFLQNNDTIIGDVENIVDTYAPVLYSYIMGDENMVSTTVLCHLY